MAFYRSRVRYIDDRITVYPYLERASHGVHEKRHGALRRDKRRDNGSDVLQAQCDEIFTGNKLIEPRHPRPVSGRDG